MTKQTEIPTIDTNALKNVTGGCAACRTAGAGSAAKQPTWWNNPAQQPSAAQ